VITRSILSGEERCAKRDVVVLNSAMALYLGIDDCTVEECIRLAQELIDSGKASSKLDEFCKLTQKAVL
jgi:anthranilate phosphoribosyltransferase